MEKKQLPTEHNAASGSVINVRSELMNMRSLKNARQNIYVSSTAILGQFQIYRCVKTFQSHAVFGYVCLYLIVSSV